MKYAAALNFCNMLPSARVVVCFDVMESMACIYLSMHTKDMRGGAHVSLSLNLGLRFCTLSWQFGLSHSRKKVQTYGAVEKLLWFSSHLILCNS